MNIVFDADMFLYVALLKAEQEINWGDDLWTLHVDLKEAEVIFNEHVKDVTELVLNHWNYDGEYGIIMCLSSPQNFRKELYPEYKANRQGKRRPLCYNPMRDYIRQNYNVVEHERLEADDCVGLLCSYTDNIAVSGDKDFQSIPCRLYDFMRDTYHETTPEQADYFHLYQTLVGDTADGYKGCPKVGDVRAKRILDRDCSWKAVVNAYTANGSTEQEALMNAQLAFILRKGYYNETTGEIKLWKPTGKEKEEFAMNKTITQLPKQSSQRIVEF